MKVFEYRIVPSPKRSTVSELTDVLNDLGAQGWELVVLDYGCWILKRERQSAISELARLREGAAR